MKLLSKYSMLLIIAAAVVCCITAVAVCGMYLVMAYPNLLHPHIEIGKTWELALVIYGIVIVAISGIPRWLGASRWLAVCIPTVPLVLLLAYCLIFNVWAVGEGGAMPYWFLVGILLVVALPTSLVTVFIIPKRHGKPSA